MAPRFFGKAKSRTRRFFQAAPQEPASALSPPTPSPTPSRPVSQPTTQPTSQPTPSPPTYTSSLPSLQERLWNEAYDGLKASEPKLVGAQGCRQINQIRSGPKSDLN
ncbi:hypothetical protein B0J15DRAFT_91057 [Fusarium solani]|uniref:Uncharacterized protein n=1 Tax=Fusarium solani TaxID=169388 RepID=A0A9P9JZX2_FUSSL|nr:uncharacterized protein B0J15DRAFT_91057 [Fusarium solani]KAH7243972.1 hypothetical protein B0J15DRAFT_91057 [Fusarium solani]